MILNCTADGNPPPNITWSRLASNSHVTFPLAVRRQDEGGYRCTADNGFGIKIRDVFITVQCEYDYLFHDAWGLGMDFGLSIKSGYSYPVIVTFFTHKKGVRTFAILYELNCVNCKLGT